MEAPTAEPPPAPKAHPLLETVSVEGFDKQPNIEAKDLQKTTGIPFLLLPHKIPLSNTNRLLLAQKEGVSPARMLFKYNDLPVGFYLPEYNAFFYREEVKKRLPVEAYLYTVYHEMTHALTYQLNPDLLERDYAFLNAPEQESTEEWLTLRAFFEGVADWIALEALLDRKASVSNRDRIAFHVGMINTGFQDQFEYALDLKKLQTDLTSVVDAAKMFDRLFVKNREKAIKLYDQTSFALHSLGHNFVEGRLNDLLNKGLSRTEAILFVVQNPPVTLEDLVSPPPEDDR